MAAPRPDVKPDADRPGVPDPDRGGDRLGKLERELEQVGADDPADAVHTRGRQPGAHGKHAPHRNVKPGTRDALEDVTG